MSLITILAIADTTSANGTSTPSLVDTFKSALPWLALLGAVSTWVVNIMNNRLASDSEKKRIGSYQIWVFISIVLTVLAGNIMYWLGVKWFNNNWPAIVGISLVVNFNYFLVKCLRKVSKFEIDRETVASLAADLNKANDRIANFDSDSKAILARLASAEASEEKLRNDVNALRVNAQAHFALWEELNRLYKTIHNQIKLENILEGFLVQGMNDSIYQVQNGRLRWIINRSVFDKYGYKAEDVLRLPESLIRKIPAGDNIT